MKIAVIGGRNFQDKNHLGQVLSRVFSEGDTLISGGAKGADSLAENWARWMGFACLIFKPNWKLHGRSAGFRRNHTLISQADKVIAFWDGASRGTAHSLELARKKNVPVEIHRF